MQLVIIRSVRWRWPTAPWQCRGRVSAGRRRLRTSRAARPFAGPGPRSSLRSNGHQRSPAVVMLPATRTWQCPWQRSFTCRWESAARREPLPVGRDRAWMPRVGEDPVGRPPARGLHRLQDARGLRLPVGRPRVVGTDQVVEVVEDHLREQVPVGADRNDPGASGPGERWVQPGGQGEVTEEVRGELRLMSLWRAPEPGYGHDPCVVDQDVQRTGP